MTSSENRVVLRSLLTDRYADFKRRLARRLGSSDAAGDVLHETYLRLERFEGPVQVANPNAYLLRMALNIASDRKRAQERFLTAVEIDELWRLGDDTMDPEAIVSSRAELEQFKVALGELSVRSRAILMAARVDDTPHDVIAERFGISTRMVLYELRQALEHCARRLERKVIRRFGPAATKESK